ncbi:MAG: magnesium chelatase domain-containing protein [Candidatus Limnocylindrales bacterium]
MVLATHDVYASLAGGLSVSEPALDLPLAAALASSFRDAPLRAGMVLCAEIGLLGELRPVVGLERRLREAARLGFERAIVPAAARRANLPEADLALLPAASLSEALRLALAPGADSPPRARPSRDAGR